MEDRYHLEKECISEGYNIIAGVDEVGRGALAGPLLAGAVVFDIKKKLDFIDCIKDSKKMTAKERKKIAKLIQENACDYAFGSVNNFEIDTVGVGSANVLAFKRALSSLKKFEIAIIDGNHFKGLDCEYKCYIKGEDKSLSIAVASIIAKVKRNEMMECYKGGDIYGFASNKGYGSAAHLAALKKFGHSDLHRKSFLPKDIFQKQIKFM